MPYITCIGPEALELARAVACLMNCMKASASLVNPSRSSAYTQKAASRIQTYR